MVTAVIQPSFAAGEVSPTLFGRVDLAKYRVGLALARNFFIDYRGGASNRPGTRFVQQCRDSINQVRLVSFKFSQNQTFVIELGNYYARFIQRGASVLESAKVLTGITQAAISVATTVAPHGYSNGDWVQLGVPVGMTELDQRTVIVSNVTAFTFQLNDLNGNPIDTSGYAAFVSGTVGRVYTITTPWPSTALSLLKFTQDKDVITFVHPDFPQYTLSRLGTTNWVLAAINFGVQVATPTGLTLATTAAGTVRYSYVVTAVNAAGEESLPLKPVQIQSVNIGTTAGTITLTWNKQADALYYNIYKAVSTPGVDVVTGATHGYIGQAFGTQFNDGNIVADFTKTPPSHDDPFAPGQIDDITVTAGGAGYTDATISVSIADAGPGTGANFVPIIVAGVVQGFIKVNGGRNYVNPTITITDSGVGAGATATATLGDSTGLFPGVTDVFQQRRIYAASHQLPSTMWASRPGLFNNFDKSNPTVDDDALTLTLYSKELNDIKSMIAMPGGLVVFTAGGAWQVSGGQQGSALTATKAEATPQAYNGCSDIPPIAINFEILYVEGQGSTVRDLSYSFLQNIYTGTDMSVLANHLFYGYTLVEWAYAEEPFKLLWAVRSDGKMLCLTFLKEQEVAAWSQHDTDGVYKSVTTVPEDGENIVYTVVRRKVQGTWFQYIERFQSRLLKNDSENSWFLDSALEYPVVTQTNEVSPSAVDGDIFLVTTLATFAPGDVDKIWRGGGGIGRIKTYLSATSVVVEIYRPITYALEDGTPIPINGPDWSMTPTTTTVRGLYHLVGRRVSLFGDGSVFDDQEVSAAGTVTFPRPVSRAVVGLRYKAQLKTLPLDTGEPTTQGKPKRIGQLNTKINETRGLKAGRTFETLTEFKVEDWYDPNLPPPLMSGDRQIIIDALWDVPGQMCYEQSDPLPASILAIIPDVEIGDTYR